MSDDYKRQSIIFFSVLIIFIAIMFALPSAMRDQAADLQCKHRLKRLGDAVNEWVYDNRFRGFPPIKNPQPMTPWNPNRANAASNILRDYLGGDIPKKKKDHESDAEFIERLRRQELSVCPINGYEYWYESIQLEQSDVRKIAEAPEHHIQQLCYFSCQHNHDASSPHMNDEDQAGIYAAYGRVIHRVVNKNDLAQMRERLSQLEAQNANTQAGEWSHDLLYLRKRVAAYEQSLAEHPEGFPAITLETDVRFINNK